MDHKTIKEQIFALYDGELDAAARKEVESHMAGCVECRELYQNWVKTAKALFQAPKADASEFFVRRVMDQIHALEAPRQKINWNLSLRWLVPAVGLAAMLLLAPAPSLPLLSTESLLMNSGADTAQQWMFSKESPKTDEVLGFVLEGSS